jgi:hypothetical protein
MRSTSHWGHLSARSRAATRSLASCDHESSLKKTLGAVTLIAETRRVIAEETAETGAGPRLRLVRFLRHLGITASSLQRPTKEESFRNRPGPEPRPIAEHVVQAVETVATHNPWYGYTRIAVTCRRAGHTVKYREAYIVMRDHRLLQSPASVRPRCIKRHGSSSWARAASSRLKTLLEDVA